MKPKIILILTLLLCIATSSYAQNLVIRSLAYAEKDLSARTHKRFDNNGVECALLKLRLVEPDAQFEGNIVGDVVFKTSEYWVYMANNTKRIKITVKGYLPLEVNFNEHGIAKLERLKTYILTVEVPKKTNFVKSNAGYISALFQAGSVMGVGASVGGYIKNFNLEGSVIIALTESEEIAWKSTTQGADYGYTYTYKPLYFGLKLGYGIRCGNTFRITPQLGIGLSSITGTEVQKGNGTDPDATNCYAVPASVGARFELYLAKHFGLCACPEYGFAIMSSDTFSKLSDVSSKVKGFGSGFNARLGVFVSF